jgi:RNA polymerase sigma-70 factor (ECF subfamily)
MSSFDTDAIALIPSLERFACSLCRSRTDAEDLVQETLAKALRARNSFKDGSNMRAWMFTIMRNAYYVSLLKFRGMSHDVDGRHAAKLICGPEQEWRLQYGELLEAIEQLHPNAREALLLVAGVGLSYDEAAEVTGCAVGTIKSRVNRARERLGELLDFPTPSRSSRRGRAAHHRSRQSDARTQKGPHP